MSRFDICLAFWLFARDWHSGQSSKIYGFFGRLNRIGYKPARSEESISIENCEDSVKHVYYNLAQKHLSKTERAQLSWPGLFHLINFGST